MKLKKKKGFTLIELLIVVAIIAILAAIAIPQFSQYRIKGYNSSATADLRNARTAVEAFFSDWQAYPSTNAAAAPGNGIAMINTTNTTGAIAAKSLNGTSPSAAIPAPGFTLGISQNVAVNINTDATAGSFTGGGKNTSGDRCFGMDSDSTAIFWVGGSIGKALQDGATSMPASKASTDDFTGIAGGTNCDGAPSGAGQTKWVAL